MNFETPKQETYKIKRCQCCFPLTSVFCNSRVENSQMGKYSLNLRKCFKLNLTCGYVSNHIKQRFVSIRYVSLSMNLRIHVQVYSVEWDVFNFVLKQ